MKTITVSMDLNEYADEQATLKREARAEGYRAGQWETVDMLYRVFTQKLHPTIEYNGVTDEQRDKFNQLYAALSHKRTLQTHEDSTK